MAASPEELRQREFAERFGSALETWRFHLNSFWARTNYFALLQVAAFSGLWNVVTTHRHLYTAIFLSLAASAFTLIWLFSGLRMYDYIAYWWSRAGAIEREFDISPERSLIHHHERFQLRGTRIFGRHSYWIKALPCTFLVAWMWMLGWSIAELMGP